MTGGERLLRINLGCCNLYHPDWANVDWGPLAWLSRLRALRVLNWALPRQCFLFPRDLILANLRKPPLPFTDNSAAVIFSGYCLEYLTPDESQRLLGDCCRVLAPGGLIRLCQTDIETIIQHYTDGQPDRSGEAAMKAAAEFHRLTAPENITWSNRIWRRGGLQQLFDKPKLTCMLGQAGFRDVHFCPDHVGECPDLDAVERPDRPMALLLHVEARKPQGPEDGD
jgi:SAM-dependent methyltransferase